MADPDLSKKSLLDLVVALLRGHAARLADSLSYDPDEVAAVLAELRRRTGRDFGADPHAWRHWLLSTYPLDRLQLEFAETRRQIQEIERRARRKLRR